MRTRGQPAAVSAIRAMLSTGVPHAVLLSGPPGVGKTTLALDVAAALLCEAPVHTDRPCGSCRACRMVEHGNHPDLHRLAPVGAGATIPIGGRDERGVRDLVAELSLLPVEGGARVAIVEAAHRLTEDAQAAFLKTLEEPPARTTILLCTDEEERLLPTIRSRCVRIRLGPMGARAIETVLGEREVADAPTAARLARLADGRPGLAIAYALAPEAAVLRSSIARILLDLLSATRTRRLTIVRELMARAGEFVVALDTGRQRLSAADGAQPRGGGRSSRSSRGRGRAAAAPSPTAPSPSDPVDTASDGEATEPTEAAADPEAASPTRVPASERRRAALALVGIWRSVVRDVAIVGLGEPASVVEVDLLDDLTAAARQLPPPAAAAFLGRLDVAGERLEGNVSPELVLDALALRWRP